MFLFSCRLFNLNNSHHTRLITPLTRLICGPFQNSWTPDQRVWSACELCVSLLVSARDSLCCVPEVLTSSCVFVVDYTLHTVWTQTNKQTWQIFERWSGGRGGGGGGGVSSSTQLPRGGLSDFPDMHHHTDISLMTDSEPRGEGKTRKWFLLMKSLTTIASMTHLTSSVMRQCYLLTNA